MSGDDADFAAYLAARWGFLVRTLVLLGCPQPEAEELVRDGLARCHSGWRRVRESDDVDVHVHRTVLDGWHRRGRRRTPGAAADAAEAAAQAAAEAVQQAPDATEQVLLRHALVAQLAGLSPDDREAVVLHFVTDLTEDQVADVLDVPVGTLRTRVARGLAGLDLEALRETSGRDDGTVR
ncbi:MAG: hypothetical protein H6529_09455 [Nocardioides sp.]|nr:hypothetical protein [Nocardioidaceae bacterium]MCB8956691.1 hypothetical protein [Nocardioides sp.]